MPNSFTILMPPSINDEGDKIGLAFDYLFKIIHETENSENENIYWDFRNSTFLTPFFLLPLMLYKEKSEKKIHFINCTGNLETYFNTIHFSSGGLNPQDVDGNFENWIEKYSNKRYIPIINFPATLQEDDYKNQILGIISSILQKQLNIDGQINIALNYLLSESVNNITEHSGCDRGYIFAQYYPYHTCPNKFIFHC